VLPRLLAGEAYVWAAGVRHLIGKQGQPARLASQIMQSAPASAASQRRKIGSSSAFPHDGALKESKCSN